jgi:poly-beta-hydroxybutyrate-responsive repressor
MSRKTSKATPKPQYPGAKKAERYIQPSILLALKQKPSYGYELISVIPEFGFMDGQAPPGMIYRHLRDLEENGLVSSEWETDGTGPAKRVYQLTDEGVQVLDYWIDYLRNLAEKMTRFIQTYQASL